MKALHLLPWALAASAFVIPDEQTAQSLRVQVEDQAHEFWEELPSLHDIWKEAENKVETVSDIFQDSVDSVVESSREAAVVYGDRLESAFEATGEWLQNKEDDLDLFDRPPHHPPHHGPPGRKRPHHPHHPPNQTVYQLIANSKYTTKLAKLINEYDDIVKVLNDTKANLTVFAPSDRAFEKIPKHAPKPSKEQLKAILTYHVSPSFYPAGRILTSRTIPTALQAEHIGKVPQRLSTQIGFRGLTVNYYARVIAPNRFGTNGVIHGIDSLLVPPPKVIDIVNAFPGEFSTLELAVLKTGLGPALNDTSSHNGGTLFAPSNWAFQKLGPRVNAFLFSKYGEKYLKALLLYHLCPNVTLYSDAVYAIEAEGHHHRIPKGLYHLDMATGLEDKKLSVDVARYGRLISIKINGFFRVAVTDGIASDGVIQVLSDVLIPPKRPGADPDVFDESMSIEELVDRLSPFVEGGSEIDAHEWDL